MDKDTKLVVGLDVHKETILVAVLPTNSDKITKTMQIKNEAKVIEKTVKSLPQMGPIEFVYEAGPCGYEVQRQISEMGHKCVVIAPSLIPVRPGDRVKTDRRDAEKLARLYRAGELTIIRVPTRAEEAARDLVRVREDAIEDRLRARHRLSKFLLRQGRMHEGKTSWGHAHWAWLKTQTFPFQPLQQTFEAYVKSVNDVQTHLAMVDHQVNDLAQITRYRTPVSYLRCLKGIDTLSALTLIVEAQDFRRFKEAPSFMSYTGLVVAEDTSARKRRQGGITKAGNARLRRVLGEAAWSYRHGNFISRELRQRREGCPAEIIQIAQKAQSRLGRTFRRLLHRNKPSQVAVTAVARELAGFVWAIGQHCPVNTG